MKPIYKDAEHPMQPVVRDEAGVVRFKPNAIVEHLLEHGGIDMNAIARLPFDNRDREQFAQLIGYSVSGFGELSYARPDIVAAADRMVETGESADAARIAALQEEIDALRAALREPMARLFAVHPDDLGGGD